MASKELILPAGVRSVDLATRSANMPTRLSRTNKAPASRGRSARAVNEDPFAEVGTSGLKQYGGFVLEEWLVTLRGRKGAWAYREMMDNSPIAGGIIFAIKMLAKQVEWRVEDDVEGEFVESCMNDMSHTWGDFISEALSMIGYGWSFHETVYKRRNGGDPLPENLDDQAIDNYGSVNSEEDDVPPSSQYKDGKIGWRRLPVRAQETLMRWEFSGYSTLRGMEQIDWHGGRHNISIQKALLFRTETTRNNPEGRALALETPIPTPDDGWKTMGELKAGDAVLDENGNACTVTALADWTARPRYRITFDCGTEIVADERHQWPLLKDRKGGHALHETGAIAGVVDDVVAMVGVGPHTHVFSRCERIEDGPTRCIEVDSPSHLFLAGTGRIPTHNSLLRNAWTSYFAVKNIQAIEAIGIERDLAGIPVATPPDGVDLSLPSNKALLEIVQDLVTGIRRDEDEGVVLPQHGWELELLNTGGSRQIDTDQIIRRYENRMTTSVLADFLMIGQDSVGSYAMVDVKAELFGVAVDAILDLICEVMNRYAIPRLLALNGMKPAKMPRIAHSSAGRIDLRLVGEFLTNLSLAGAQIPWTEKMMEHLFRAGGLPEPDFTGPKLPTALPSPTAHDSQWRPAWGSEDTPSEAPAPAAPVDREHVAKAAGHSGAMVALYPAPHVARALARKGGEPAEDLHLTLAFLGDAKAIKDVDRLLSVVEGFAASTPPISAKLAGSGMFTANGESTVYASPDAPTLPGAHARLMDALKHGGYPVSDEHGFTPHITLAYSHQGPLPSVASVPMTFDHVSVVLGGERHDFPLSPEALSKAEADGEAIHMTPILSERAGLLSLQLEREILSALDQLGNEAGSAYMAVAQKSMTPRDLQRLVGKVMSQTKVSGWVQKTLGPLLQNHAGRVLADTTRVVAERSGQRIQVPESAVRRVKASAGSRLKVRDIEPQVRESIMSAVVDGHRAGDGPVKVAQRIRESVPRGRFVNAGMPWRAQLIARDQTANLQREASLAAYDAMDNVGSLEVVDGVYGPPRSDEPCMARSGEILPINEARLSVHAYHILCTLGFNPIVSVSAPEREPLAA